MLRRIFSPDPAKTMSQRLIAYCPEPTLWKEISAYLIKGRRPRRAGAKKALRRYLELRDHLGARAAFAAGAPLTTEALEGPCRRFLSTRPQEDGYGQWARFCLAADHLLIMASQVRAHRGKERLREIQRVEKRFLEVAGTYLEPLTREAAAPAGPAPHPSPTRARAA